MCSKYKLLLINVTEIDNKEVSMHLNITHKNEISTVLV